MEKSYFDIKVTFVHVFVLLVAVIAIGVLLFYMGFQAGQKSARAATAALAGEPGSASSIPASAGETEVSDPPPATEQGAASNLQEEARLHQVPVDPTPGRPAREKPAAPIEPARTKPATAPANRPAAELFTIQVGAFDDFGNAKRYADRYLQLNLPAEIIAKTVAGRKLHTVRVGRFATLAEAKAEQARLERMENKKFLIEKTR